VKIDGAAAFEEAAPLRLERQKLQVSAKVTPSFGEDPSEDGRINKDGWPHVEAIAALPKNSRFAANPRILLENRNAITTCGENTRRA